MELVFIQLSFKRCLPSVLDGGNLKLSLILSAGAKRVTSYFVTSLHAAKSVYTHILTGFTL